MNRIEALNQIGKLVVIDEKTKGKYIGQLLKVKTIPKKPWRGLVKIKGVLAFPEQNWEKGITELVKPIYEKDALIEVPGIKIHPYHNEFYGNDYETSIVLCLHSLVKEYEHLFQQNKTNLVQLQEMAIKYYPNLNIKLLENERDDRYIYYRLKQVNAKPVLVSDAHPDLPLTDCPFEFELLVKDKWIKGHYTDHWLFESISGKKYLIRENDELRLAKKHLEPYQLLLNELEKPALQSLEKSLRNFKLNHQHLLHCHNELLLQLLTAKHKKKFSGVNFMFYQKGRTNVTVQHHYERELVENGSDKIYDRFEVTSSDGRRYIVTYTNEFSRGK